MTVIFIALIQKFKINQCAEYTRNIIDRTRQLLSGDLSPVSTTRVGGPSTRLMEKRARQHGPCCPVLTGNGNRALQVRLRLRHSSLHVRHEQHTSSYNLVRLNDCRSKLCRNSNVYLWSALYCYYWKHTYSQCICYQTTMQLTCLRSSSQIRRDRTKPVQWDAIRPTSPKSDGDELRTQKQDSVSTLLLPAAEAADIIIYTVVAGACKLHRLCNMLCKSCTVVYLHCRINWIELQVCAFVECAMTNIILQLLNWSPLHITQHDSTGLRRLDWTPDIEHRRPTTRPEAKRLTMVDCHIVLDYMKEIKEIICFC